MSPLIRPQRVLLALLTAFLVGCGPRLQQPMTLHAPYPQRQLWAVAPPANESGVSIVDAARLADLMAYQLQDVRGVDVVPVNRVIAAQQQLNMMTIESPADAMALMNTLGVDGLIVSTVTAWDPYPPPTLGLALELHLRSVTQRGGVDAQALIRQRGEDHAAGDLGPANPVAQAAGVFDARNHLTLTWVRQYAAGRTEPGSAYGPDVYLVNMELYTQFVCHRLLHDLLRDEQARLAAAEPLTAPSR